MRSLYPLLALAALSCSPPAPPSAKPVGQPVSLPTALGLPPVPIPAANPPTRETIALGEKLFNSRALSADGTRSCADCHNPATAFAEPSAVSTGIRQQQGKRNAPTVLNAAFLPIQFHDGRAPSLEAQASGPILNAIELGHTEATLTQSLAADPQWLPRFTAAFGPGPTTLEKVTLALASFERTLISANSPLDRFLYAGDKSALNDSAQRGLALFRDPQRANCAACHLIGDRYALFTDGLFHNLGAGMNTQGEIPDPGRFAITKLDADRGAFRTPTLRNVARTAPYMHDGSLKTLSEVIAFYIAGGNANPHLDPKMKPLALTKQDRADLLAFLESLTGDNP
jgi:cytochrome c peroxidase